MIKDSELLKDISIIIEDNPIIFDEDFLLDVLKIRLRWPKNSIEVISQFGNKSEDFFDSSYNALIFDKWLDLYEQGFTTMLNNCLDIHNDMRHLESLIWKYTGERPIGNIYMSKGSKTKRSSFDVHSHDYNVISTSVYGTTTWMLGNTQFDNKPIIVRDRDSVIIPKHTNHAVVESPEKRCSLTLILG